MTRYELSEGTSNKFWDIQLDGTSFTTTWGRIGTSGQATTKSFASADKAKQEHDKLVAEKVKKGYQLVGGATPAPAPKAAPVPAPKAVPVPAPKAAPVPAPKAVPVPAPAPKAAAPVAPSEVVVTWTDAARRRLTSERAAQTFEALTAPPARKAYEAVVKKTLPLVAKELAAGAQSGDASSRAIIQRLLRTIGPDRLPTDIDPELAGAAIQLLGELDFRTNAPLTWVIDLVIATGGLGLGLAGFAATLGDREVETGNNGRRLVTVARRSLPSLIHQRADVVLHRHWLGLDDAGRATARAAAEALRADGSLLVRSALASTLLVPAWIDDDLRAAAGGERAMLSPQALVLASDPVAVAAYLEGLDAADARLFDAEVGYFQRWLKESTAGVVASLLARFDAAAAIPLAARGRTLIRDLAVAGHETSQRARELRAVLEIVRCVPAHPASVQLAAAVLRATHDAQLARDDDPRPLARECLLAAPAVALPIVRAEAAGKGGGWAKDLVAQLERLVDGGDDALVFADPAELPAVLRAAVPAKAKLPTFWNPRLLPPLRLRSGRAVPPDALTVLALALRDGVDLGDLRDAVDRKGLAEVGWELFQLWLGAGAPSKEKWMFTALGVLGDDETARRLTPLIRAWPGESQHQRATVGLDILGQLGTDVAMMMLNGIAQKLKFKGLQERARDKMDEIAESRGMTAEQLADRLVPDLDLEDDGSKTLDFGPRSFRVGFDEVLAPFVMDAAGTRLKDLPKPNSKDDATLAAEATEAWKAMKKDARAVASIQLTRLELAMGNERRWSATDFRAFFVEHPLLGHVVKRLVWAVFDDGGAPVTTFRVAEDRTCADRHDDACALADDAEVGLAHPLHLTDVDRQAWAQVFSDYELVAPFAQLAREVHRLAPDELGGVSLARFEGHRVETKKLLGLLSRGWFKGPAQDAGQIHNLYKPLEGGRSAAIGIEDGINAGGMDYVDPVQTLGLLDVAASQREWHEVRADAVAIRELSPVVVSELLRDLASLGAAP